jgi:hypothetical protein
MTAIRHRLQHALEDTVYYFWVGVGVTFGTVTVLRFLFQKPSGAKARP